MATGTTDLETKIEILLKLAVIPEVKILAPRVSVNNDTVTLGGIVDAFWKKVYIANIVASELTGRQIQNNLSVVMGGFPDSSCEADPEMKPVHGPEKRDMGSAPKDGA
jgi:hypothetical protein